MASLGAAVVATTVLRWVVAAAFLWVVAAVFRWVVAAVFRSDVAAVFRSDVAAVFWSVGLPPWPLVAIDLPWLWSSVVAPAAGIVVVAWVGGRQPTSTWRFLPTTVTSAVPPAFPVRWLVCVPRAVAVPALMVAVSGFGLVAPGFVAVVPVLVVPGAGVASRLTGAPTRHRWCVRNLAGPVGDPARLAPTAFAAAAGAVIWGCRPGHSSILPHRAADRCDGRQARPAGDPAYERVFKR
jgi:hypothetical protein